MPTHELPRVAVNAPKYGNDFRSDDTSKLFVSTTSDGTPKQAKPKGNRRDLNHAIILASRLVPRMNKSGAGNVGNVCVVICKIGGAPD